MEGGEGDNGSLYRAQKIKGRFQSHGAQKLFKIHFP